MEKKNETTMQKKKKKTGAKIQSKQNPMINKILKQQKNQIWKPQTKG